MGPGAGDGWDGNQQEESDLRMQASLELFEAGQCVLEVAHTHLAWGAAVPRSWRPRGGHRTSRASGQPIQDCRPDRKGQGGSRGTERRQEGDPCPSLTSTRDVANVARVFTEEQQLYQPLTVDEDRQRTNIHYEQPVEFFYALTGGDWNVYSANLWTGAQTQTESQERKLDLLAEMMELRPGMRILDVGCGWGGPLTYLSKKYGVRGVGLTLSALQKGAADERIAAHGVDVAVVESHWKEYQDDEPFDAVFTDEVIVHFFDLGDFFRKVYGLLRDGGLMLNKELHFAPCPVQRDDPRHVVHPRNLSDQPATIERWRRSSPWRGRLASTSPRSGRCRCWSTRRRSTAGWRT